MSTPEPAVDLDLDPAVIAAAHTALWAWEMAGEDGFNDDPPARPTFPAPATTTVPGAWPLELGSA